MKFMIEKIEVFKEKTSILLSKSKSEVTIMGIISNIEKLGNLHRYNSYLNFTDDRELTIENCESVCGYDENRIMLNLMRNTVEITGTELCMENFGDVFVKITGKIHSVTFSDVLTGKENG